MTSIELAKELISELFSLIKSIPLDRAEQNQLDVLKKRFEELFNDKSDWDAMGEDVLRR